MRVTVPKMPLRARRAATVTELLRMAWYVVRACASETRLLPHRPARRREPAKPSETVAQGRRFRLQARRNEAHRARRNNPDGD